VIPPEFVFLSQEDVVAAGGTDMAAMVDVIERAFRVKAAGEVRMPHKAMITWADEPGTEERDGRIMAMPAYVGGEFDVAGLKWIPSVPDNPSRKRPAPRQRAGAPDQSRDRPAAGGDGRDGRLGHAHGGRDRRRRAASG
jgi:ornithine cyclodeaminase/alanine dehydrogenase-like protein (mu-crystallin family)